MKSHQNYAPGMRIVVRDAQWVINRADPTADGGYLIECEGICELVRGKEGRFLTAIENDLKYSQSAIEILDPAQTRLIEDKSPNYKNALLYIESLLRQKVPTDEQVYFGHRAAMDTLPFQLDPTLIALKQPRQRILIADAVGLGKTLEAGILMAELIRRGRGKRILVLAVKSMLTQFQKEMWSRFTIPLTRLDSTGLQRVRNRIPTNHNPFHFFDKAIISIDTLKQDVEYRHYLEQAYWDIIVIDEAHNVAKRGANSQRSRLASLLAQRSDTLIMLSATPHDGKPESFASLMNMLDATAISNEKQYQHQDFSDKGLVVRRFKKDIKHQIATEFPERQIETIKTPASSIEEDVYQLLAQTQFTSLDKGKAPGLLFRVTLEKALFSSPVACLSTVENRLARLEKQSEPTAAKDVATLTALADGLRQIDASQFAKYQRLLLLITDKKAGFGWKANKTADRLVIFTESIATLHFLANNLVTDLALKDGQLGTLHGQLADADIMHTVEEFGKEKSKLRILVCSDVASEGINLHYLSHKMIHFDIPWSLMVFQQRNGRIDRYGQNHQPQIRYLLTESVNPQIGGDSRILEVLIEKDQQAHKNIGDPSEFSGVFDQQSEEDLVADIVGSAQQNKADMLAALFDDNFSEAKQQNPLGAFVANQPAVNDDANATQTLPSLFHGDIDFAAQALAYIRRCGQRLEFEKVDNHTLTLTVNKELTQRLQWLPPEIYPQDDQFVLTSDIAVMKNEIAQSRGQQHAWPRTHYCWQLHPVMQWLNDKVLSAFGRHHAPMVRMPNQLAEGEDLYLLAATFPNRKSHPLINDWIVVRFEQQQFSSFIDFDDWLQQLDLANIQLSNPANSDETERQQQLLPTAIDKATDHFSLLRKQKENSIDLKLTEQLAALDALRKKRVQQMSLDLDSVGGIQSIIAGKKAKEQQRIEKLFDDYMQWIEDTMTTEKQPYIQLIAVFTGQSSNKDKQQ
ncbi:MAG: superfamily II DNA or RNA helicase [Phenylobacterium sp.]|jgi:superfamily II DNA or RNA helicase